MNAAIGGSYQPKPEPKTAAAPAPAPTVTTAPAATVTAQQGEPTDPFIRARMGLPKL
jgi:hypothetical protein